MMENLIGVAVIVALLAFALTLMCLAVYLGTMIWKVLGLQVIDRKRQIELQQEKEAAEMQSRKERAMAGKIIGERNGYGN